MVGGGKRRERKGTEWRRETEKQWNEGEEGRKKGTNKTKIYK